MTVPPPLRDPDAPEAPCANLPHIFESTHPKDHATAKTLCYNHCPTPTFQACEQLLEADMESPYANPVGTYAGRLLVTPTNRKRSVIK